MNKIYAICSGGDWYDASVDHLILPDGINIKEEEEKRNKWHKNVYSKQSAKKLPLHLQRKSENYIPYLSLVDWLKKLGAVEPDESQLEEYWI